jgi:serine/threonine-protein kinase RsbW
METLVLPAVLDSLDAIARFVIDAAGAAGLSRKATYHLRLAVDEVATNIITHGYEEAGDSGDIAISAALSGDALTITLEDSAVPFDPRSLAAPPQLNEPLEERPLGGLGVFLALKNVDGFDYARAGGKNRNTFIMRRQSVEAAG